MSSRGRNKSVSILSLGFCFQRVLKCPSRVTELIQIHKQSAYLVGRDRIVRSLRMQRSSPIAHYFSLGIGYSSRTSISIKTARRDTVSADNGEE